MQTNAQSFPDSDLGASTTNLSRAEERLRDPVERNLRQRGDRAGFLGEPEWGRAERHPRQRQRNRRRSGTILRISGNNEVIGTERSTSTSSEGGIVAPKLKKNIDGSNNGSGDSWFRLPAIDVTMVAGESGVIQPRITNERSGGQLQQRQELQHAARQSLILGVQWAPTRCSPRNSESAALNAGAGPLATVRIAVPDRHLDDAERARLCGDTALPCNSPRP
ncbi:hypothetical protein GS416_07420 [Rhodococcus hoagii]|nr:hypothetical protein [Prescottella equi]